ncbi:MAG: universal stress protein [Jatrophihabitans sp.]|uniref:universal stress protein n=1 Tax=Jatrophihabitans sp. TaxID=1932789 RepID=UPI003F80569D
MTVTPINPDWHGADATKGPVVIGVSPSTGSPRALRWAADYARTHGLPLRAIMAWRPPRAPAAPGGRPPVGAAAIASTDYAAEAQDQLQGFVEAALHDEAEVECRAVKGSAVTALLAASTDAELMVLGEVQAGAAGSVRTGLVAPKIVLRAACPVVVMPRP